MTTSQLTGPLTESFLHADTSVPLVDETIGALLQRRARECPDRLALIGARHGSGNIVRLSYADLLDEAYRVATGLAAIAKPGEFVALWAPNVIEWPIIEYGAALAGVILVALNPVLRLEELDYAVRHSGTSVLLFADHSRDYHLAAVVEQLRRTHPNLVTISLGETERWMPDEIDREVIAAAPTDPDAPVMLQYTSGTTGNPKGVLLRHRSLVNVAKLTMEAVNAEPGAVAVNPLPMFHTAACVIGTLGPLWLGGTEILIEQFTPSSVLDVLREESATVLFYVPAILGALLAVQSASDQPAPHLDVVMGGASNVPAAMIESAERIFGATVINLFGQTELAPVLSATRPNDSREDQLQTVGRPLPQVDCKVVDPATGEVQPVGTPGEICARGYQQLIEYLHDPDATAATVDGDGFVHMGDLGTMDERGYLTVTGRLKEMIIRGGENISPVAVENELVGHPDVAQVTVIGLPDDRYGEIVAAVITVAGAEPDDLGNRLVAHARQRLAPFKVPTRWFVAEQLPATPTGKIRKFKVRDQVSSAQLREITPEEQ
ncbi:class I adenylate-forming enzyme family protein [Gordonia polyisoprenivorans]|uniref:class I adenylate-forming enzyme family protein n=1 Tax=Gordonia polyisoprenivorans TaxID=84595 RepID=UPI001AD62C15|nr:AMP-binding protein [Gordonia polyisoprenivorans]QTI69047.1 AMP-binding protein [Gordonia polyisoprenivorans]